MNLDIKDALHGVAYEIPSYANSVIHKSFTWIGGGSAAYQLSDSAQRYIPDVLLPTFNALWSIEWMQLFSGYAVVALCIERTFVLWAWNKRRQRGDYEAGKPQDDK